MAKPPAPSGTRSAVALSTELDRCLRKEGDRTRAAQEKRYLKSNLRHYGVTVSAMRRVVTQLRREQEVLSRVDMLELVRLLWVEPVHERRAAAIEILEQCVDDLRPVDMGRIESMLRECQGWALLDNLAASVVGPLVERHPRIAARLDRWAADPDFWMRRASLLALLIPLREGRGDFERFGRYADAMLEEREPFIRKTIGWVLRDTSKKRPRLVVEWLLPRVRRASGLTVREAVRRLPDAERRRVLAGLGE